MEQTSFALENKKLTPLMQQFWDIKKAHMDKILLFRMGDFYEMFYDDAKRAAPILNIALTSRNKKAEDETPMCGVPHHSIAGPIGKLLSAGLKVAICDQLEDPELAKGIVKRGVTRVLSPGMVYDPESLNDQAANYVAALDDRSISFMDATTGECFYYKVQSEQVIEILTLLRPTEILLTREQSASQALTTKLKLQNFYITTFNECDEAWPERFSNTPTSAKRLLTYATNMQGVSILSALGSFEERVFADCMTLGTNTLKHLEVFQTYRGDERGSLFYAMNRTQTSAGARKLKNWLRFPLLNEKTLLRRQLEVERWYKKPSELKILRAKLSQMGDIERRLTKISYANFSARDITALLQSLKTGYDLSPLCSYAFEGHSLPNSSHNTLAIVHDAITSIERTIVDEPPLQMKNGGYIRKGFHAQLDELIELSENAQKLLLELETRERDNTQISSLKVRYNNVFGYYIEVTNAHTNKVPDHYKRKQTLANAERYVTQELSELESKILSSREKRVQLESELLNNLRLKILKSAPEILKAATVWSELDVLSSLSWLALEQSYVRPEITTADTSGMYIELKGSRHPVVEQEVRKTFVANDVVLSGGECLLLTGPNMAGKSTLMRQVAVTILMAQVGSFVPASSARLTLFEQIFTRIGASDSLSEGLSTFMVEMIETAEMLNAVSSKSLVVLDEVGRGTSTYDGMSLAQSILEYLVTKSKSVTMFATHYHEITGLCREYPQIRNAHMSVAESGENIEFLYILRDGPASESYGIRVAKLAGLPIEVISRAKEILREHENKNKPEKWHQNHL